MKTSEKANQITHLFKITTIEQVYDALKKPMPVIEYYSFLNNTEDEERALNNQYLQDIQKLFNQEWIPTNTNRKYYGYFDIKGSGLVFYDSFSCEVDFCVGQVAYYKSKEISDYCCKTFIKIYEKASPINFKAK